MVAQADAVAGEVQGSQRVQEAGGQTAQSAVAQTGLRFQLLQVGQGLSGGGQALPHVIVETQIDEVVGKKLADQKFSGDIVELPPGDGPHPACGLFPCQTKQGQIQLPVAGLADGLAAESGQSDGNNIVHENSSYSEDFACIFTLVGILYPH